MGNLPADERALPGYGLPIDYRPKSPEGFLFRNALDSYDLGEEGSAPMAMLPLREFTMLHFMNKITDKPDWHIKVMDDTITTKWKNEVVNNRRLDFVPEMADFCFRELRARAKDPSKVFVYNGDVVKSDSAVPLELKQALQAAVTAFEDAIPEKQKDWHPGSDGKVWDLVHPSLFPLVYGVSRVLPLGETTTLENCIDLSGGGKLLQGVDEDSKKKSEGGRSSWRRSSEKMYSHDHQWLPCEVDISGENARITTYINNLHPEKEKPLYSLIEKLIDASIPLWNWTLTPISVPEYYHQPRIPYNRPEYDPDPKTFERTEGPQEDHYENHYTWLDAREEWLKANRKLVLPVPRPYRYWHPPQYNFDLKEKFGKKGLQIIVKLANIQLTREKPEYNGGVWHVEGMLNERIVSTSLYYYSCENVTESTLSFRQQVSPEAAEGISLGQDEHDWLIEVYGCRNYASAIQDVGSVVTREGRLLTFPNVLQHRVSPFKLIDRKKPGHRKIVALFLVDPNIKIISTANVPCQRQDWWWERVMAGENSLKARAPGTHPSSAPVPEKKGPAVDEIPIELQDNILTGVDFPMSMDQAKKIRLKLMDERKNFVAHNSEMFKGNQFSLCEH